MIPTDRKSVLNHDSFLLPPRFFFSCFCFFLPQELSPPPYTRSAVVTWAWATSNPQPDEPPIMCGQCPVLSSSFFSLFSWSNAIRIDTVYVYVDANNQTKGQIRINGMTSISHPFVFVRRLRNTFLPLKTAGHFLPSRKTMVGERKTKHLIMLTAHIKKNKKQTQQTLR